MLFVCQVNPNLVSFNISFKLGSVYGTIFMLVLEEFISVLCYPYKEILSLNVISIYPVELTELILAAKIYNFYKFYPLSFTIEFLDYS